MYPYAKPEILDSGELDLRLGQRTHLHLQPWSRGMGMRHTVDGKWCRPSWYFHGALLIPAIEQSPDPRVQQYVAEIPQEIRDAVRPFAGFGQISLIHWAGRWPQAYDLVCGNPALLWFLAVASFDYRIEMVELHTLLSQKQRTILGRPLPSRQATASQLKLLRKVDFGEAGLAEGRVFHRVLSQPHLHAPVRHCQHIPIALLALLARYPDLASAQYVSRLSEFAGQVSCGQVLRGLQCSNPELARELDAMVRTAGPVRPQNTEAPDQEPGSREGRPRSIAEYRQRPTQRTVREIAREFGIPLHSEAAVFPPAPLQDDEHIRAIRTVQELESESKKMSHCVRNYADSVRRGERYFYKVLHPQRATLEIRMRKRRKPVLGDCKLSRNRIPSKATMATVREWIERQGGSRVEQPPKPFDMPTFL